MVRAATVIFALFAPALALAQPAPVTTPQSYGANQRYVVVFSPHANNKTIMLDTQTGRTWLLVQLSDLNEKPYAWVPIERMETPADDKRLVEKYGLIPK